nr:helix-turn-helix transcriptional regulator [Pseudonocardia acidicola]
MARHLTARERECLALLVEGLGTKAMARRLGVATTTVRSHVQATLTKLGTHSRLEAAALAVRYDLVPHGPRSAVPDPAANLARARLAAPDRQALDRVV